MSDPWASVLPSVIASSVTAVITTLLTLAVAGGARSVRTKNERKRYPIRLIRDGSSYTFSNRTRRSLSGFKALIQAPSGQFVLTQAHFDGILYPGTPEYTWTEVENPQKITAQWVVAGRKSARARYSAAVRLREDQDDYLMELDPENLIGMGG